MFELFPPVQKMPAWQAFLAAGESGDAEAVRAVPCRAFRGKNLPNCRLE